MKKQIIISAIIVIAYFVFISQIKTIRVPDMTYTGSGTSGSQLPVGEQIDAYVERSLWSWLLVRGIDVLYIHIAFFIILIVSNLSWFLYHRRNGLRATSTRVGK